MRLSHLSHLSVLPSLLLCLSLQPAAAVPVDAATRTEVVQTLAARMAQHYVDHAAGARVAASLRARLDAHAYDGIDDADAFAARLAADLLDLSGDKHTTVVYMAQTVEPDNPPGFVPDPGRSDVAGWTRRLSARLAAAHAEHFGFPESRRLAGKLAYIRIDGFDEPAIAGPTLAAEMAAARDASALILDLRANGGGNPETVTLLCAWLFDDAPVHLNDQLTPGIGRVLPVWTQPVASDLRFGSRKPVVVLVGPDTFSAAENLAYTLQSLGRATVVGAATGGGANGGRGFRLADHFLGSIPNRTTIDPRTHGNWQGRGVQPDVRVEPEKALDAALETARALAFKR